MDAADIEDLRGSIRELRESVRIGFDGCYRKIDDLRKETREDGAANRREARDDMRAHDEGDVERFDKIESQLAADRQAAQQNRDAAAATAAAAATTAAVTAAESILRARTSHAATAFRLDALRSEPDSEPPSTTRGDSGISVSKGALKIIIPAVLAVIGGTYGITRATAPAPAAPQQIEVRRERPRQLEYAPPPPPIEKAPVP
jgi:hypothetical protein